jgi:uncharacterized protein (DUF169 family)
MESKIKKALHSPYEPVAVILTDQKPAKAKQFQEGKWGCVMFMFAAAARGQTAVFDRRTFGCFGGGVGLGFGRQYLNFPGGEEGFCYFLSTGNENSETGKQTIEQVKPFLRDESLDNFIHGERYQKSPEKVRTFIDNLPIVDLPFEYVVFKPLSLVGPDDSRPEVVVFLCDADEMSALVVLANYDRGHNENVIIPWAAGCQTIGIYPFLEAKSENSRAVVGLTDLSARVVIKKQFKADLLTFAIPYRMFEEMEANVAGSFFERHCWNDLLKMKDNG